MTNEANQHSPTLLEESFPREKLSKIKVPSSPATELNIMTQGDLDRLWEACSFPSGVRTRILRNGETILSTGAGEVAFYEATFPTSLRCLYALFKGPGSESGWLYFKVRPNKNILKGAPSNVKRWKKRFFFILGDDWEFHLSIPCKERVIQVLRSWGAPGKRCNKVPTLSETKDKRFRQVFEKIGEGGHFKIPAVLGLRTFQKYFTPNRAEMSSSGGGTVEGHIRGKAATFTGDSSESLHSQDVSRHFQDVPCPERIKLSQLTKTVAEKAATSSFKGMVISEVLESPSKKRVLDDGSKGKQVAQLPEAKKAKTSRGASMIPAQPLVPGEGSTAKLVPGEALGPQASMMAITAMAEKFLARVILPADKEKVEKLTFDQVVTKFIHIMGQEGVILGSSLAVYSRNFVESANNLCTLVESSELEMVAEMEKSQALAKRRIIAEFKELEDFQEAVMGSASSYFGDDFNFCKRQLKHHHPDLSIDFDDLEMDRDFLAKEEAETEEREKKEP
ncbi:hypothetical protein Acr_23g0010980 [Actinidia rufa]|uniref:Uncharacterized protein n=1 Tax=Actinidia rufa TaxID=165716 RepID=A0A7J0GPK5_9ERIC|nr:hypothetical protein Acr_23g0010980 [Actinidia rufa]